MNKAVSRDIMTCIFLVSLLCTPALQAEIYRWTDQQGQIHFSDAKNLPPQATSAEQVKPEPNVIQVQPGLTPAPRSQKKEISSKNNSSRQQTDIITRLEQARRKCATARENLAKVRQQMRAGYTAGRYRRLHEREIRYMDDRQRHCH